MAILPRLQLVFFFLLSFFFFSFFRRCYQCQWNPVMQVLAAQQYSNSVYERLDIGLLPTVTATTLIATTTKVLTMKKAS